MPRVRRARRLGGPTGRFRELIAEIDACSSLHEPGAHGKRLYALDLPHEEAGVAWSRYRLYKQALDSVALGEPTRALVAEVEDAAPRALPRLGARLYRLQQTAKRLPTFRVVEP